MNASPRVFVDGFRAFPAPDGTLGVSSQLQPQVAAARQKGSHDAEGPHSQDLPQGHFL